MSKQIVQLQHRDTQYLVYDPITLRLWSAILTYHLQHEIRRKEKEYERLKSRLQTALTGERPRGTDLRGG